MPTTPSGMTQAEAEALSLQQQQQLQSNLPGEGQVFLRDIGEGGRQLSVIRNGQIHGLGFDSPQDWQGRTIGSWQNEFTSQYAEQLGLDLSSLQMPNMADLYQEYGEAVGSDIGSFGGFLTGGQYGGPTQEVTADVAGLPEGAVAQQQATIDEAGEIEMAGGQEEAVPEPIPFKEGLNPDQIASIQNLVAGKPNTSAWNPTDIANWNYATGGAPLPGGTVASAPVQTAIPGLDSDQITGLDAAYARQQAGTSNQEDDDNLAYAQEQFGYVPGGGDGGEIGGIDPVDQLMQENNITVNPDEEPTKQFTDVYSQIYSDLGLTGVKEQLANLSTEIQDMKDKKDDEIQDVNDNPWLTEGVRLRRIASIERRYENKLGNLTDRFSLMDSIFKTGVQQAQFVASQSMSQNRWQQAFDRDEQWRLEDEAQKRADALNSFDSSQYRSVNGGLYDLKNKSWVVAPKATGGGGGGSSSGFNEKAATTEMTSAMSTVVGTDGFISPDDYAALKGQWRTAGGNPTVFDTKFKGFRNPNNDNYLIGG
jgi:hypothetical protein